MANSRKNGRKNARKGSRKNYRKASRRSASRRSASRRCWTRRQSGGMSPVEDASMKGPSNLSLAQGRDYEAIHSAQHGGAAVSLAAAAPVGYTGMLDDSLRATARVSGLDASYSAIAGMSDQAGGARRRRRGGRKSRRSASRKSRRASRKARKTSRRGRKMRGGAAFTHMADYGAPGMLLSSADAAKALGTMNPEWKLAENPASFAPKMA